MRLAKQNMVHIATDHLSAPEQVRLAQTAVREGDLNVTALAARILRQRLNQARAQAAQTQPEEKP